jgi:hypothetical protein
MAGRTVNASEIALDARSAFAVHNPKFIGVIELEKITLWNKVKNSIYRAASFWTPIVGCIALYFVGMYGLIMVAK